MKALKVEIPKGFEFESFDSKSSEIKLKQKPEGLPTNFEELLEQNGIGVSEFLNKHNAHTEDELAYAVIKLLAQTLNQGWTPNWSDSNESKYYPWFEMRGSSGFRFLGCGSLAFAFARRLSPLLQNQRPR